jgi:hypothetical protein
MKFLSRKFLLLTAMFIVTQILKFMGKIGDWPWIAATIVSIFGFAALQLYFKSKGKD